MVLNHVPLTTLSPLRRVLLLLRRVLLLSLLILSMLFGKRKISMFLVWSSTPYRLHWFYIVHTVCFWISLSDISSQTLVAKLATRESILFWLFKSSQKVGKPTLYYWTSNCWRWSHFFCDKWAQPSLQFICYSLFLCYSKPVNDFYWLSGGITQSRNSAWKPTSNGSSLNPDCLPLVYQQDKEIHLFIYVVQHISKAKV